MAHMPTAADGYNSSPAMASDSSDHSEPVSAADSYDSSPSVAVASGVSAAPYRDSYPAKKKSRKSRHSRRKH